MIEFTLARVCMGVCGLFLLAAVVGPVTGMYESNTMKMESNIPGSIAVLIDDYYYSDMDTLTLSVTDILPNASSCVRFDGHMVTVTTERGTYKGGTNVPVVSGEQTFGYGDIIKLSRLPGAVTAEKLA